MSWRQCRRLAAACTFATVTMFVRPSVAEEIVIGEYGFSTNAMPFAVALEKGFFKEAGADVTGILGSAGGGTTIRNLMSGNLAYGEAALPAVILAIQNGASLKIISANTTSAADMSWVARADSTLNSLKDLAGKKLAYTNPGSTTQSLAIMMLDIIGLSKQVELVKTGGLGEGLAALDSGVVDVAPVYEPVLSEKRGKYKVLGSGGDVIPALITNVGFTTKSAAGTRAKFIEGVIAGRRKAVEFMHSNPDEAAAIVAKIYHMETSVVRRAFDNVFGIEKHSGTPYYGLGEIKVDAFNNGLKGMKIAGSLKVEPVWSDIVDEQFLPADQKAHK